MKTTRRIKLFLLFSVFLFSLVFLTLTAVAQAVTNAPAPIGDTAAAVATPFIVGLSAKYTWLVTVLAIIGVLRVVFKPFIAFLEVTVKATATDADDKFLAKCEASAWFRWLVWILDWLGSIKPPGAPSTNPALTKTGV